MSRTIATMQRVLMQLRNDHRTMALLLLVPVFLMALVSWVFSAQVFDHIGLAMLGIFPFITMFLVTSIATLRERQTGTLERLLSMPLRKVDFILGYQLAFAVVSLAQSALAVGVAVWLLGLDFSGPMWMAFFVAMSVAQLGTALGLAVSALAQSEFQAVQFMPAIVIPQLFLCGLFVPREQLNSILNPISDLLPLSYAIDVLQRVAVETSVSGETWAKLGIIWAFVVGSVAVGSLTLRRRSV
jgi:ABC transporter DrrB family efflux protein